jgi:hypothetical protein
MAKPSQVIVLVEDNRQQQLVRRYLLRIRLETHVMRFVLGIVTPNAAALKTL